MELKNMITTSKNEVEFLNASLQRKNEEINKLNETIGKLSVKIQEIQEENIALRSQMSYQFQDFMTVKTDSSKNTNTVTKPKVLLLGTSNTKGINEDKLSSSVETQKIEAFTLDQARNHITTSDLNPNVVVLHILTNDLKTKSPQECVQKMQELVELISQKWEYISCIISLTTPRQDSLKNHTNGQIINAMLKQVYDSNKDVLLVDHNNMLRDGNPDPELLREDKYHLSNNGISQLSANLKHAIHSVLNIPLPTNRGRSLSRNRRGRGRGRGRHNYN